MTTKRLLSLAEEASKAGVKLEIRGYVECTPAQR